MATLESSLQNNYKVYRQKDNLTLETTALVKTNIPTMIATRYWATKRQCCFFSFSAPMGFSWNGSHVSLRNTQWYVWVTNSQWPKEMNPYGRSVFVLIQIKSNNCIHQMVSLHVHPVHVWVLSCYSGFLPPSKNMHVSLGGDSKLTLEWVWACMVVWLVGLCVALWWPGLFRVYPTSQPMSPGRPHSPELD